MADTNVRGRFVWHELLTPNPEGAHEFYGTALGWKKQPWEHDPKYLMFVSPSGPVGAAYEKRDGTPQWVPCIGTTDVDATVEAAQRLGARVQTPSTPLPNGRYAVLEDPQGAVFGVHASSGDPMPEAEPRHGDFSWHELASTADPLEVFRFYSELFGWEEVSRTDMGAMGTYLIFGRNGAQLGGIFNRGQMGRPGPAYWLGYVRVGDLDGTVEKAKSGRGSVLAEPMEVPNGDRIAQLTDPHGALFALHCTAADAAAARAGKGAEASAGGSEEPAAARAPRPGKAAKAKPAKAKPAKAKSAGKKGKAAAKSKAARSAGKPAKKTAKKAAKKSAKKTAKKAGKKAGKKTGKKTGKQAAKRGKTSGKRAKKAAGKPAGKAGKQGARKAKGKAARKKSRGR